MLRNPQFRRLWLAQVTSILGDRVKEMALLMLGVLILGAEHKGEAGTQAVAWFTGAMLALSPFAGVLVDRVSRRRLMVVLNLIRMVLTLSFIVIAKLQLSMVCVNTICCLLGAMAALYSPAILSALPETLHRDDLQRASSFSASTGVLIILLGTAAGGKLIGLLQSQVNDFAAMAVAFGIDATTFALAAWFVKDLRLTLPRARSGSLGSRLRAATGDFLRGLRLIFRYRQVRDLLLLCCLFWVMAGGVFGGLMKATDLFGWSVGQVSMLFFSIGLGMIFGGIVIKSYASMFRQHVGFPYGLSLWGVTLALLYLAHTDNYHSVGVGLVLLGAAGLTLLAPAKATLQQIVPAARRGKIFGVFNTLTLGCYIFGMTMIPRWTDALSRETVDPAVGIRTVILLAAVVFAALAFVVSRLRLRARWDLYWFLAAILRPVFEVFWRFQCGPPPKAARRGPMIVIANHTSYFDALLLSITCPRQIRWMITERFYKSWWGHWLFKRMNCICVAETGDRKAALKAALSCLSGGDVLGLFPEGRLSLDGELQDPQPGAAFMALRSGVPVYAAAIDGAFHAYPKGRSLPRLCRIRMAWRPEPLIFNESCSREQASTDMMDAIRTLQTGLRSPAAPSPQPV